MKRKLTLILASVFLCVGMALAQTPIKGVVVSAEDNEPVIGATVKVAGSKQGAVTDINGEFSVSVAHGARLEISYVGMITKVVKASQNMRIALESDAQALDEVMVVAYGTAKKSAFTGSAGVIKSDEVAKVAIANPVQALTGKVSGVQVNAASGQPGQEGFKIRIRGVSSINADNEPLLIVDGVPYDGDMNSINTADIESMTVLKDAASAAIYGARGANGVVLITTKSGANGKTAITVDAKWGSNSRAIPDYEYIKSPERHYELWYQALNNYAQNALGQSPDQAFIWANQNLAANNSYGLKYNIYNVPEGQYLIGMNGKMNPNATQGRIVTRNGQDYMLLADDWQDATYKSSLRQEYTLTAQASNTHGSYFGSVGYLKNEGITIGSDFTRFSARMKADYQLRPWLKVAGNFNYSRNVSNYLGDEGSSVSSGNIFAVNTIAPIYPLYLRDGNGNIMIDKNTGGKAYDWGDGSVLGFSRPTFSGANPINTIEMETNRSEGHTFNANGSAEIRFLKDFKFTTVNNVMVDEARQTNTTQPYYGQFASMNGGVATYHTRTWSYNYQQLLNWRHVFDKHDVEVLLGHEYYRSRYYLLFGNRTNQFSPSNDELAGAITDSSMDGYRTDYNTEGFFARAQYNYDNKYFASASFRRDASSRFAPENRWGNFWSFGGAWIISKEQWFNADWVDILKFKASYGEQGNDRISSYLYTDRYNITNSNGSAALAPSSTMGNRDITWETGSNFNIGVEFGFFKNRLTGSVEYFNRKTSDMLAFFSLPPSFGYTGYYSNIGDMVNRGVEIELNGDIMRTKDFTWSMNLNMTAYKNKITYMPEDHKTMEVDGVKGYSSTSYFYGEGEALYTWYLPKYAGVDPETGEALYWKDILEPVTDSEGNKVYDENGKVVTQVVGEEKVTSASDATQHLCGTALPDLYGGFGTSFAYKGFDLSLDFTYQIGGKVLDSSYASAMAANRPGNIMHADIVNAWTPENTNTNVPRIQYNDTYMASSSDRFLTSGSYLSLQNVNFGYTLPSSLTNKIGVNKVRIYASGANLWLWSKRQGLDPRQSINGSTSSAYYAPIRSISGGISVTF